MGDRIEEIVGVEGGSDDDDDDDRVTFGMLSLSLLCVHTLGPDNDRQRRCSGPVESLSSRMCTHVALWISSEFSHSVNEISPVICDQGGVLDRGCGTKNHATPPDCPPQCLCVPNRMSCEKPGLRHLPSPYMLQIEHLVVQNQTFDSTHLGPTEMSMYTSPEYGGQVRLKRLHIRFCNIRTIGRNAFQALGSNLEMLDLTGNPLKHIGDYAFAGLGQLTLILDYVEQPELDEYTFEGLAKMKSLIMRHSNLVTLPYKPLLHLSSEGKLDKLLLKGNHLRKLDEKFDNIFMHLQDFEIAGNPWHCDCQLTWLIRRYRLMLENRSNPFKQRRRRWPEDGPMDWEAEDNQPKCGSPPALIGRNFSDLITSLDEVYKQFTNKRVNFHLPTVLYCPPPHLQSLDINLQHLLTPALSRQSSKTETRTERTSDSTNENDAGKTYINLKCAMKGSPQLAITWNYHHPSMGLKNVSNLSTVHRRGASNLDELARSADSWSFDLSDLMETESDITVRRNDDLDVYSCLGQDVIGNVSALIRVHWPPTVPTVPHTEKVTTTTPTINVSRKQLPNEWPKDMITSTSMLHSPKFSLGELLGAIAGTFLSTVLLFFIVHHTLHCRLNGCDKQKRTESAKSEAGILQSPGVSPAGTSSSNASSSNTKLISPTNGGADYCPGSRPVQINPEALSLTANLLNAHAYHQLINGNCALGRNTLPVGLGQAVVSQGAGINRSLGSQAQIPQQQIYRTSDGCATSMAAYEPVAYSDANNLTYDIPLITNMNAANTPQQIRMLTEQHIPLLFSGMLRDPNRPNDSKPLQNSGLIQSALMIPPPPSIPQPSLPASSSSLTLTGSSARTPMDSDNLMALQSGFPIPANHNLSSSPPVILTR
ncbi:unnamed protein product [Calicophoron daubneyi]|uniref:Ig-like domain-containing protein n=1 Tax=Calicophoron daubneyi TaxID=300641 RepID=A0AAV2TJN9_CALDB